MVYDEQLAERIRQSTANVPGISERKMFGGICFMVNGNMALGPVRDMCMIRVGPEAYDEVLAEGIAQELDFTGHPMRGMVQVDRGVLADDDSLAEWIDRGISFAQSLPPKIK